MPDDLTPDPGDLSPHEHQDPATEPADVSTGVIANAPRSGIRFIIPILGLMLLAGGGFYAFKALSSHGGAATPQGAVRDMFEALSNEDMLGVLATVQPGERDAIRDETIRIARQLERLGVLKKGFSLSHIDGVDLNFKDLQLKEEALADGLVTVRVTGGAEHHAVDPSKLPVGPFLKKLVGPALQSPPQSGSSELAESVPLVAVRDGGRWFIGLGYSIAEAARRDLDIPTPTFGRGIAARPAATPEAAVEAFLRAAANFNVEGVVAMTPPDEMRALHDYAPLFARGAQGAAEGIKVNISKLELGHQTVDGETFVAIKALTFDVASSEFTASYDGRCFTSKGLANAPPSICTDELRKQQADARNPFAFLTSKQGKAHSGFVVVHGEGGWTVSPIRTVLGNFAQVLRVLEPGDLDQLRQFFEGFLQGSSIESRSSGSATLQPVPSP